MFSSCRGGRIQPVNVLESMDIMPANSRGILLLTLIVAAPIRLAFSLSSIYCRTIVDQGKSAVEDGLRGCLSELQVSAHCFSPKRIRIILECPLNRSSPR